MSHSPPPSPECRALVLTYTHRDGAAPAPTHLQLVFASSSCEELCAADQMQTVGTGACVLPSWCGLLPGAGLKRTPQRVWDPRTRRQI